MIDENITLGAKQDAKLASFSRHTRLIPMIVAVPMFLQAVDTSILGTALQSIAASLNVEILHLNFAISAYLLSLALFLPASGWLTDRFGTRRVFCSAVAIFSLASALCGAATSITQIVLFRILQGLGGAMMVPVGRLILLRSIPPAQLVMAMVWFTVPGTIGRVLGPLLGGFIVTLASWRWIFLLNIPFGVLGILLSLKFVPDSRSERTERFDLTGFVLMAIGLSGVVCGVETIGRNFVPLSATIFVTSIGIVASIAYWIYSRDRTDVIIPLSIFGYKAFSITNIGGMPLRIAVGSAPIFVPLLLQVGVGFTPIQSGLTSAWLSVGAFGIRPILRRAINKFGFKPLMITATVLSAAAFAAYGSFSPGTSIYFMSAVLFMAGIVNSLGMVTMNTVGFSGVPKAIMSKATALSTMMQQTSMSFGVALCAFCLTITAQTHGHSAEHLTMSDFPMTFFIVGALSCLSVAAFISLPADEGAELR
ncbi:MULTISPECIES: MFS transporter [unclassified Paraburkholderia]|uniref:MFS transporter n=1 Tax=unclassified Paraburkholderia TaxID=2615204 RepID=UPI00185395E6|nr:MULTISPECIES: MFS transporter [unclassified Paraburkholderia]MBB5445454.1 EmrB/QacA subfamily drug resistance transporter [Paraburkholderia sp. WSM4177]MBB5486066.1 EmrB/QacA subfamily drug resistance transporter [Paraburkholderia sp. WSM4180]